MTDIISTEELKELNANEKARQFLKLAELKKEIVERYEEIRKELLETTQNLGIKQLKTDDYTISRARRVSISIYDDEEAGNALEKLGVPVKYEKKLASHLMTTIRALAKDKDIAGIEKKETEYILVKINKE